METEKGNKSIAATASEKPSGGIGGYLFLLLAGSLWGTTGIFVNALTPHGIMSEWLGLFKLGFACILMFIVAVARNGFGGLKLNGKQLLICLGIGVLCQGFFNICYLGAIQRVGMAFAGVLLYTSPVIVAILSTIFFHEKMTGGKVLALACNIIGCTLTVTGGDFSGLSLPLAGIVMGFGAAFFYALAPLFGKLAVSSMDPTVTIPYTFLFGSITVATFIGITGKTLTVTGNMADAAFWVAGAVLIPTVIAYAIYYKGLSYGLESSKVGVLTSVELVVATLIGVIVYHDPMGPVHFLGVLLVVASIVLMNVGGRKAQN